MQYKISFIQDEKDFYQIRHNWQSLYNNCVDKLPFQAPCWYYAWWKILSPSNQIMLVAISKEGQLVSIAPFYIDLLTVAKTKVRVLRFIGNGPSEINDILIKPNEDKNHIISELFRQLSQRLDTDFDIILLEETVKSSSLYQFLKNTYPSGDARIGFSQSFYCPHLDLKEGEKIKKTCSGRDFSRKLKKLSSLGQVDYTFTINQSEICKLLPEIVALHNQQWSNRKDRSQFETSNFQNFIKELLEDTNFQEKIFVSLVKLNSKIVSFDFGYVEDGTIYPSRTAFHQDLEIYSPGFIMNCLIYKKTNDLGYKTINLGRGRQSYKTRIANRTITTNHIIISSKKFRPSLVTKYLQFYFFLKFKLRDWQIFQYYTIYGARNLIFNYFNNIFRSNHIAALMIRGNPPNKKISPDLSCQAMDTKEIFETDKYQGFITRKVAIENTYRGSTMYIIKQNNKPAGLFWLSQTAYKISSIDELINFKQNDYCIFGFEPIDLFTDLEIVELVTSTTFNSLKGRQINKLIAIMPTYHKAAIACFKEAGFTNLFSRVLLKLFNMKAFGKLPYGRIS